MNTILLVTLLFHQFITFSDTSYVHTYFLYLGEDDTSKDIETRRKLMAMELKSALSGEKRASYITGDEVAKIMNILTDVFSYDDEVTKMLAEKKELTLDRRKTIIEAIRNVLQDSKLLSKSEGFRKVGRETIMLARKIKATELIDCLVEYLDYEGITFFAGTEPSQVPKDAEKLLISFGKDAVDKILEAVSKKDTDDLRYRSVGHILSDIYKDDIDAGRKKVTEFIEEQVEEDIKSKLQANILEVFFKQ